MFSPHFHISEVAVLNVKAALLQCFKRWGLPRSIKVDNGKPFGDPQLTSVPEVAMWLAGMDVTVIWNPPRTPRANAKVERMQRSTAAWAEIEKCADCHILQIALDKAALMQREKYGVRRLQGKTRKQAYAALWQNTRSYKPGCFDIRKVYRYLVRVTFKRKINLNGSLNFYGQKVYVGRDHRNKVVDITFDSRKKCFNICEKPGEVFATFTADNFTEQSIQALNVCRSRTVSTKT